MSGSSLDGLDLCCCDFIVREENWSYVFHFTKTVPFPEDLANRLSKARDISSKELFKLDADLGDFIGQAVKTFMQENCIEEVELIASHGHTVFHSPESSFSTQIGSGAHTAAACGLPVVSDLRSGDLAKGGQGAPIVPIGELLLFQSFDAFLNLGGIANISIIQDGKGQAWDIAGANQVLNHLAKKLGKPFDDEGKFAVEGEVDFSLIEQLDSWEYYQMDPPKSLDNQQVQEHYFPLVDSVEDPKNALATFSEHLSAQIVKALLRMEKMPENLLVTGGGAHNKDLIKRLELKLPEVYVHVPNGALINFKEALIMAFIGLLRFKGQTNIISSITGAESDSISGAVYLP